MIGFNHLGRLGQLGNQMFQYAATKGIARKLGVSYTIPDHTESIRDALGNNLHIELFKCFNFKPENTGLIPSDKFLSEEGFHYQNKFFNADRRNDFSLYGFFQTEKYFKHIEDEIRQDFKFNSTIQGECEPIVDEIFDQGPIALHIRRGDFLINSGNHHNLSLDYYEEALSKFAPDREVILFSDDIFWACSQELFKPDRFLLSEGNSSYHDLYMMTQCSDFIIANSTFSWWGAWLGNTGRVIAPYKWFGPNNSHLNTQDLYPEHWEIIDNG